MPSGFDADSAMLASELGVRLLIVRQMRVRRQMAAGQIEAFKLYGCSSK